MDNKQPRAGIWTGAISVLGEVDMARIVDNAKHTLQNDLSGTGLFLVGLAVIEECRPQMGMRLSWKVFSGPYPSEEADRA